MKGKCNSLPARIISSQRPGRYVAERRKVPIYAIGRLNDSQAGGIFGWLLANLTNAALCEPNFRDNSKLQFPFPLTLLHMIRRFRNQRHFAGVEDIRHRSYSNADHDSGRVAAMYVCLQCHMTASDVAWMEMTSGEREVATPVKDKEPSGYRLIQDDPRNAPLTHAIEGYEGCIDGARFTGTQAKSP
jgi:hypothetical protein